MRRAEQRAAAAGTRRVRRGESGVALVEMAIVIPLLMLLVFGLIDFGVLAYRDIGITQGLREAARQGAVANFDGGIAACTGSPTQKLVCQAKQRMGVGTSKVSVEVIAPTNAVGASFAICATYQSSALTGFTQPFIPKFIHSETIMRLEQAPTTGLTTGGDADPEGNAWASCKAPTS